MTGLHRLDENISPDEREVFKQALSIYYAGGGPIADAFAQVERGLIDRYYRRRKKHPDEMEEIDREARDAAHKERSFERLGVEARQERLSWEMAETAGETLLELLPELVRIARGEPRVVEVADGDGKTMLKTIIPYPRDQIAAFKVLVDVARYGILPQSYWSRSASTVEDQKDENVGGLMPIFAGNTNFQRIEGWAPDGTKVVVNVGDPIDAITEADEEDAVNWARP